MSTTTSRLKRHAARAKQHLRAFAREAMDDDNHPCHQAAVIWWNRKRQRKG